MQETSIERQRIALQRKDADDLLAAAGSTKAEAADTSALLEERLAELTTLEVRLDMWQEDLTQRERSVEVTTSPDQ